MINDGVMIRIVQGDTYQKNLTIIGVGQSLIEDVFLSCSKLNLCKKLTYNSKYDKYMFRLEPHETSALKPITTDFDITIKFTNSDARTVVYRGNLVVLPKTNIVVEEGDTGD